mmetsp:Transcript_9327/g.13685  ORF Transcript_9327/g.13685 Transcript_9327/m.13685 type:complete len:89 (+) Transcript_9327:62-328(+)
MVGLSIFVERFETKRRRRRRQYYIITVFLFLLLSMDCSSPCGSILCFDFGINLGGCYTSRCLMRPGVFYTLRTAALRAAVNHEMLEIF